ncbi:MAG: hypothetical protein DRJ09_04305 [Bacteroidetes bacterium]|nr:MAG: hypothetical protein DRJ09_04305 [Bacteroidota bacterium]
MFSDSHEIIIKNRQMKKILINLFIVLPVLLAAQTITVKQDSTGNFTTIQEAINHAWNGDTVLVWPGTYFENVDFKGKSITLGSLTLTTGDTDYKYSTIIDGNQTSSCIVLNHNETNAVINGFTLQHGIGAHITPDFTDFRGGGLCVYDSYASVYNCVVKNNRAATFGGGISCEGLNNPFLFLSGVSIHDNQAYEAGGLLINGHSVIFDSINLCSIYNNYSGYGNDIYTVNKDDSIHFYLDTFSVSIPTRYFFVHIKELGIQTYNYTFDCQHSYLEPVNSDLYVNPVTGSDANTGTSPDSALKTISWAYSKIKVDSAKINTIHLANGIYSESLSGERYPLNVRPYVYVTGQSMKNTVLDAEHVTRVALAMHYTTNYSFQKLTFERGGFVNEEGEGIQHGAMLVYEHNEHVVFDSIIADSGWNIRGTIYCIRSGVRFNNSIFKNNRGGKGLMVGGDYLIPDTAFVTNCIFDNNHPDTVSNTPYQDGGAFANDGSDFVSVVTGCLFLNNNRKEISGMIIGYHPAKIYLTNCTFTGCKKPEDYDFRVSDEDISMYNCIFYNESGSGMYLLQWYIDSITFIIKNSLIEGGLQTLHLEGNVGLVYEDNIDTDPLFYGGEEFPYNLSGVSPCIDAGTLDLPQFVLNNMPDTDLAGNPRVFNGKIDMGAYEWNPTVGTDKHRISNVEHRMPNLKVFPNPFSTATNIAARWETTAQINIEIYNNAGLLVKTLLSGKQLPGRCQIPWNGTGNNNNYLPSGGYVILLKIDGRDVESVKVVKK